MDLTPDQRKLYNQIVINEGKRYKTYRCTKGKLTIGIGRNLDGNPLKKDEIEYLWHNDILSHPELDPNTPYADKVIYVNKRIRSRGISEDEVQFLWRSDVISVEDDLDRNYPWWRKLDLVRQRVMIDLCFNMGINVLKQFKNTLAAVQSGNYKAASRGMLGSLWATQVDRVRGDGKGRADLLAEMMETGRDAYNR